MVLWSKEQDKVPDMSSGAIDVKKEGVPPTSVQPVILIKGPEDEFELKEVTTFQEAGGEAEEDRGSARGAVIDCRANAKGQREEDALLENASQSNDSDDTNIEQSPEPPPPLKETSISIGLQVVFPFLLAGFGTVAAGMVLDIVQVSEFGCTQVLQGANLQQTG